MDPTPAATQPGAAPSAPAVQPAPSAPGIDPNEYASLKSQVDAYRRQEQQFKGSADFVSKARSAGFDKPELFDQWGPVLKEGIDPRDLARVFRKPSADEGGGEEPKYLTAKDLEEYGKKQKDDWAREQAEAEYSKTVGAELDGFDDRTIEEIAGKDAPPALKAMLKASVWHLHSLNRKPYGDDHPHLKGKFAPAGADGLAAMKKTASDWVAQMKAHSFVKLGEAAREAPASTAGSGAGQGRPDNLNTKRPGGLPSKADVLNAHEQMKARRTARA